MRATIKAAMLVLIAVLPAAAQYPDRSRRDESRYSAYRAGHDDGYRDGLRQGNRDYRAGLNYHPRIRSSNRRDAFHYRGYGRPGDYNKGYQAGYREGYDAGYRGRDYSRNRRRWF